MRPASTFSIIQLSNSRLVPEVAERLMKRLRTPVSKENAGK